MSKILLIGAANVDIIGVSNTIILPFDSNPGTIQLSVGGVAKNIAENLKRLELDISFLTFFGNDSFVEYVQSNLNQLQIDYSLSIQLNYPSGKFMSIHRPKGELELGINDFELLDHVTVDMFKTKEADIEKFDYLVFDTNLPEEVLTYLIQRFSHKTIIVDGVSQLKVVKVKSVLDKISLLKVNQKELSALLGKPVDDIILSVRELIKSGLKQVVVTNGTNPITYNIEKSIYQTFIYEAKKNVSSIGCGDALLSGTLYGLILKKNMHESVNYGKKAASLTMEVSTASHPELSRFRIEE
ncbi:MAG: hypothetical protein CVV56_05845 [Tenericutes bacterium HGW-Tenericutes-1]|jgi:pseudouridine kinase|nr:MAG: hypothetical protein CVV56_05845 [Tenericutes bacterium HGW-Tenericutes-1]